MESPLKKDMKAVDYEKKFYWIYHAYQEQHKSIMNIFNAWENQIHKSFVINSLLIVISYLFGLLVGIFCVMRYLGKW